MTEARFIHCQNCMAEKECTEVSDPEGNYYWVCEGCEEIVENGNAVVSQHRKFRE